MKELLIMYRLKLVGQALMASLAVAAVVSTTASASMTLPEFTTKAGWTGTSGKSLLVASGQELKCSSATNSGGMEASKKLGTYTITFVGCKSLLFSAGCNSVGDAAETILTTGSWHLVLNTYSGTDKHLLWLLVKPLEFECSALAKIKMTGNLLASITPANTSTKVFRLGIATNSANQQEFTSFENDSGQQVSAGLFFSLNGSANVAATESSENNLLTTTLSTKLIN